MKKFLLYLFLSSPVLLFAQTGQYTAFTDVHQSHDTLFFEYEWFDLDPIIHLEVFLAFEEGDFASVCFQEQHVSSGVSNCLVSNLSMGWYEYYLSLEDGDQLVDSTSVGSFFLEPNVNLSMREIATLSQQEKIRVFDLLGRECDVESLLCATVYVLAFDSGKTTKIVFLE